MIKFLIGLFIGLSGAMALAQSHDPSEIIDGFYKSGTIPLTQINKVYAHLDAEELAAIKEACK